MPELTMLTRTFTAALLISAVACLPMEGEVAPCADDGACLPGYHCDIGYCLPVEAVDEVKGIGPEGGEVQGPNGSVLLVPPGALSEYTEITLREVSAGTMIEGAQLLGTSYAIEPADVALATPALLMIPTPALPMTQAMSDVGIWREQAPEGWSRVTSEGDRDAKVARASIQTFGTFAAARAR